MNKFMKAEEIKNILIGKTIKDIKWYKYLSWPMCIEEIVCTDDTIIEFGGNADYVRIDNIKLKSKLIWVIDDEDNF